MISGGSILSSVLQTTQKLFCYLLLPKGDFLSSTKDTSQCTDTLSNTVTTDGGVVVGQNVKLVCPPGAVDDPVHVKITLEDPSKYYGLIVQRDLENDVMFSTPIINLQPNGHVFKKPVTVTIKLEINDFKRDNVVILHGREAGDGTITWYDTTQNATINETNAEVVIEIGHFSLITVLVKLQKLTLIRTKDIVYRFNLLPFSYIMSVLVNKNSVHEELALLFMSQDVYNEQFYREHESSGFVQLKAEGFKELHVHSIDRQGEQRVYNSESLQVSVCLGEDYKLTDSEQGDIAFTVNSAVWWNTGEVFRRPLEWSKDARILSGTITVQGSFGHSSERHFCEIGKLHK